LSIIVGLSENVGYLKKNFWKNFELLYYYYYLCGMIIDNFLKNLTIEELIEVQSKSSGIIHDYKDGYFYICEVRSYGRNWKNSDIYNTHTLQELCYQYGGDDGIVDVYSNNPDLSGIDNYGVLKFIPSVEDHNKWKEYMYLKNSIPRHEVELKVWEERENVPFRQRPSFAPFYTREDIDGQKLKLENFDMNFVEPKSYISYDDEE
jgi:hypothetical protein